MKTTPILTCLLAVGCHGHTTRPVGLGAMHAVVTVDAMTDTGANARAIPAATRTERDAAGHCTLEPPGGNVIVAERSEPSLVLGRSGGIVAHHFEQQDSVGHSPDYPCAFNPGAVAFTALDAAMPIVPVRSGLCNTDRRDALFSFFRADGEAALFDCGSLGTSAASCTVRAPFTPGVDGLAFALPRSVPGGLSVYGAARDGTVFVVAFAGASVLGWVLHRGRPAAHAVLVRDLHLFDHAPGDYERPRIVPTSGTEAEVTLVDLWGGAHVITVGPDARATGPARAVTLAADDTRFEISTTMANGHSSLTISTRESLAPHPIPGLDPSIERTGATSVPFDTTHLVAWTEGATGQERVRLAWISRGELVGEQQWLTSPAHRTEGAALDRAGNRTVIVWDEQDGMHWNIRGAVLRCSLPALPTR